MNFFVLSKIIWLIVAPTNLFLLLIAMAGFLRLFADWRGLNYLVGFGAIGLLIGAFTPLGNAILAPLEQRFPPLAIPDHAPTGIIILGGGIDEVMSHARNTSQLSDEGSRMTAAVALARRYPAAKLVYSGGSGRLQSESYTEADAAKQLWLELGVPESQIVFEKQSRNTYQNAVFTKQLLNPKHGETWILVTSAFHMPRAIGIFRQINFLVTPAPVDYRTMPWPDWLRPNWDGAKNLMALDLATHEWLGLTIYRLTGRSNAFFPAPEKSISAR